MTTCRECSRPVEADDAFCRGCGTRLNVAPGSDSRLAGERRQLTVMFCDLVGSTELSNRLDPEDVQTVLRRYQETAAQIVGNVEGYVAQYLGDGILVYFGYPTAHEDDPLRGVSTALDIAREVPLLSASLRREIADFPDEDLAVRIGIHTGVVVVGSVGSSLRRETLASGPSVNQAARLAAAAATGSVVISDVTAGRVAGVFVLDDLGPLDLKGIPEPVQCHRVLRRRGTQSRLATWTAGSGRPIVGREELLAQLDAAWAQVRAGGTHTVVLRGEAGIGKSRLVQAMRQRLAPETHGWIACYGSALQSSSAFRPIMESVRGSLGIDEDDEPATQRIRVATALRAVGIEGDEAIERIGRLLEVTDSAASLLSTVDERTRTLDAMADWWLRLARLQPMVLALEDLHWFDPSSFELVTLILTRAVDEPVLVLGTARPEAELPWADDRVTVIDVPPLDPDETLEIVRQVLGDVELGSSSLNALVARSDGVPLYAEELARGLVEHAGDSLAVDVIPASLQDSFTARLDRLGGRKRLAQIGALLGRAFPHQLIAAVLDLPERDLRSGLDELVARKILHRDGLPPRATYTFHHALLQDVAAESMLRQRRRDGHTRIADVLVTQFHDYAEDQPGVVGHHYAEGGEPDAAIDWYARAGLRATERAEFREATADYARAVALLESLPAGPARDARELELLLDSSVPHSMASSFGDPVVGAVFRRATDLCRTTTAGSPRHFEALYGLARYAMVASELDASVAASEELLDLGSRTADPAHALAAQLTLGQVLYWQGHFSTALDHSRRAIALSDGADPESLRTVAMVHPHVTGHMFASWSLWALGEPDADRDAADKAIAFARTIDHPYANALATSFGAVNAIMLRDVDRAERLALEALELAQRHGIPIVEGQATTTLGWVEIARTGHPAGLVKVQGGMGVLASVGTGAGAPGFIAVLAECLGQVGNHEASLGTARAGLGMAQQKGQNFYDAELLRLVGRAQRHLEGPGSTGAVESLRRSLGVARAQGGRSFELRTAHTLARLLRDRGQHEAARAELAPVLAGFPDGATWLDLDEARATLAALT